MGQYFLDRRYNLLITNINAYQTEIDSMHNIDEQNKDNNVNYVYFMFKNDYKKCKNIFS